MKEEIRQYYNELSKTYDTNRFGNSYGKYIHQQEIKILNKYLSKEFIESSLDLACGTGRFLKYAKTGVDLSKEMIRVAQKKYPNKNLSIQDAESLDFEDSRFKNAISFHLFMHLNVESVSKILKEVARVTKKDGLFIFDIPSEKRRKLTNYSSKNWHGGNQITIKELKEISKNDWQLLNCYGVAFFPIHRIPKNLRKYFVFIDDFSSRSFLKEYSSHIIYVLKKK